MAATERSRFAGPLAAAWGRAAGADALRSTLLAPDGALPVPSALDRATWDPERGTADRSTIRGLLARAEAERGTPWPQPTAHQYARYVLDGDREKYQEQVFSRQERVTRAVLAAATTLDPAWIDEAADGLVLLCEQSSWCWPAHDDTFAVHGSVVPTVTDPYLDLGAGDVVGQLAWADQLLGPLLDERLPGVRARIRHEARVRVVEPFLRRRDWHWLGLDGRPHNWNPWIHGNVLVAALRLVDDPDVRADVVGLVVEGLDRYVAALPADGAVDEGYAYWWNGACRTLEALDLLEHATGGRLDAAGVAALRRTVAFPHAMHLGGDWYVNHADGQARPPRDQPWQSLHRWAHRVGDDDARRHAASYRSPGAPVASERDDLGRLLQAVTDRRWLDEVAGEPPLVADVWLPSTQVLVARERAGSVRGLTLAVKGGHNGEHHNHNDVGSVVVAVDGVPVLVDAGRPTYTAQTFGPDRYDLWPMQSTWHNVPEIRGSAQPSGQQYRARDVEVAVDGDQAAMSMDLAGAYDRTDVTRWRRSVTLDRLTARVVLRDDWELTAAASDGEPLRWHLLLAGDVRLTGPGRVEVSHGGAVGVLTWDPDAARATTRTRPLDDPMLTDVWGDHLTRLTLEVDDTGAARSGSLTLTLEVPR